MDATAELTGTPTREDYTSRPGALIWFFQRAAIAGRRSTKPSKPPSRGSRIRSPQ